MGKRKITEEQKLVDWFRSTEGTDFAEYGDYWNYSPAETAIHFMQILMKVKDKFKEVHDMLIV